MTTNDRSGTWGCRVSRPIVAATLFSVVAWTSTSAYAQQSTLAPTQSDSAIDDVVIEQLRTVIRHEMAAKDLPALSIAIVNADRVVWAEGFGFSDEAKTKPATAESVYRVGSVSKLFTDIAVMQLVEQGQVSLDAPVTDVLPEFAPRSAGDSIHSPVSLRMLMSHRSGLVREPPVGNYFDASEPTLAATVASLNQTTLTYPSETRTKYSNAGIAVVGAVLAKKKSADFSTCIDDAVLRPLQMTNSSFQFTPEIQARFCTPWMWTVDGRRFRAANFPLGMAPAGNLYSNVLDLSEFVVCILKDGRLPDETPLIQPETLAMMTTPQIGTDGKALQFGIGFAVQQLDGHRKIGHDGAVYGCSTQLAALPEQKLGVVVVSALDGSNGIVSRIGDHALRMMLAHKDGKPLPVWPTTGPVPVERARALAGSYRDGDRVVEVTELAGRCWLRRGTFRNEVRALATDGSLIIDDTISFGALVSINDQGQLKVGDAVCQRLPDEPPADIPERWRGLIGEYGEDHNVLYILEDHGRLTALIEWFYHYQLTEIGPDEFAFPDSGLYHGERLKFTRDHSGRATQVIAAEVLFKRREVGTENGKTFQITPLRPVDELRTEALAASPPPENGEFLPTDLAEPVSLDDGVRLDIRYATTNNFTGAKFYQQPRAFMQRTAAESLIEVQQRLKLKGLGLLIHDAYRPWHVTKMFWEATPENLRDFVADPARGSRHNRGCAVDLTLYETASGKPIEMVAGYDEFSPRSFPMYPGGTSRQRWYRELLRQEMEASQFSVYEFEWWHFDYHNWQKYRIGNATFEELDAAK